MLQYAVLVALSYAIDFIYILATVKTFDFPGCFGVFEWYSGSF